MNAPRPRAFLSYTGIQPDTQAALAVESAFVSAGFDVWAMHQESAGRWQERFEIELRSAHVMLPIVSRTYLSRRQCQDEVRIAHYRESESQMLVYPFFIESIDTADLNAVESNNLENLKLLVGKFVSGVPGAEDLRSSVAEVRGELQKSGLFSFKVIDYDEAIRLPFRVRDAAAPGDVFLVVDGSLPGASAVRACLNAESGVRSSGRNRWTVASGQFEGDLKERLLEVARAAVDRDGGGPSGRK